MAQERRANAPTTLTVRHLPYLEFKSIPFVNQRQTQEWKPLEG